MRGRPDGATGHAYRGCEEQLQLLMKQTLVTLVVEAEALQELMSQPHQLVHPGVLLLQTTSGKHELRYRAKVLVR